MAPDDRPRPIAAASPTSPLRPLLTSGVAALYFASVVLFVLVAVVNIRRGRADVRGAGRFAVAVWLAHVAAALLDTEHRRAPLAELDLVTVLNDSAVGMAV